MTPAEHPPLRHVRAVLFDIDGTLVDSNYLHIQAWSEATAAAGRPVDAARIHRAIGMDSALLIDDVLGEVPDTVRDTVKDGHADRYEALSDRLRPFDGARDLLRAVRSGGQQVVLATSAPPTELRHLLDVLAAADDISHVTSGDDVERAKPSGELIAVALDRAGVAPEEAVMVGDSVWDGAAAGRAGVTFVGVLSGGIGRADLFGAGAVAVYDDAAALLADLSASPLSSAGSAAAERHGPRHG